MTTRPTVHTHTDVVHTRRPGDGLRPRRSLPTQGAANRAAQDLLDIGADQHAAPGEPCLKLT